MNPAAIFTADTLGNRFESREVIGSWRPSDPAVAQLFGLTPGADPDTAGIAIDGDLAATVSAVFACVSRIAGTLSSCPVKVVVDDGSYKPSSHPAGRLFQRPNNETTWPAALEALIFGACLQKGGFAEIVWGGNLQPTALHVLDPRAVEIRRTGRGQLYYLHHESSGAPTALLPEDVLHIRGTFGWDGVTPNNRVTLARRALALAIASERFAVEYFDQAGSPEGYVRHPAVLGEGGVENLRNSFALRYKGAGNRFSVPILEEGAEYVPVSMNAQESQLTESRLAGVLDACRFYDMPPAMIGVIEATSYASVEMAVEMFKLFCMTRWAKHVEAELNGKLFRGTGSSCKFNLDAVLRGSTTERMGNYVQAHAIGLRDLNELRAFEDAPPIAEGDRRLEPLNHQSLATAAERDRLELEKLRIEVEQMKLDLKAAKEPKPEPPPQPLPINRLPVEVLNGNGNHAQD